MFGVGVPPIGRKVLLWQRTLSRVYISSEARLQSPNRTRATERPNAAQKGARLTVDSRAIIVVRHPGGRSAEQIAAEFRMPSFVATLGLGLALKGVHLPLLLDTAHYGLMNTGMEKIAQMRIDGAAAWLVLVVAVVFVWLWS